MGLDKSLFYCKHGHNAEEHPNCWKTATIYDKDKTLYLDIETTNLKANFGFMISWAALDSNGKIFYDHIEKKNIDNLTFDKEITQSLCDLLVGYKRIYTYYGTKFDVPFIRTRAMIHKIQFPSYKEMEHVDLYYIVRNKLCLNSNRLATVTGVLGIEGKTPINHGNWMNATAGDKKAIGEVLRHNIADVEILMRLHKKLKIHFGQARRTI